MQQKARETKPGDLGIEKAAGRKGFHPFKCTVDAQNAVHA